MIFEIARHSVENSFINILSSLIFLFVMSCGTLLLWSVLTSVDSHQSKAGLHAALMFAVCFILFIAFAFNVLSDVKNKESKTYYYSLTMKYNNQKSVTCIEEDKYKLLKKTELTQDNIEKIIGKDIDDIFKENTCPAFSLIKI